MTEGGHLSGRRHPGGPDGDLYYVKPLRRHTTARGDPPHLLRPGAPKARLSASPQWGERIAAQSRPRRKRIDRPGRRNARIRMGPRRRWQLRDRRRAKAERRTSPTTRKTTCSRFWSVTKTGAAASPGSPSTRGTPAAAGDHQPEPLLDMERRRPRSTSPGRPRREGEGDRQRATSTGAHGSTTVRRRRLPRAPAAGVPRRRLGELLAPEHDYPSYLEINLSATD